MLDAHEYQVLVIKSDQAKENILTLLETLKDVHHSIFISGGDSTTIESDINALENAIKVLDNNFNRERLSRMVKIKQQLVKPIYATIGLPVQCACCGRKPSEIPEYVKYAKVEGISAMVYVINNECTFNPSTGRFYCTSCYIEKGMPLGVCQE